MEFKIAIIPKIFIISSKNEINPYCIDTLNQISIKYLLSHSVRNDQNVNQYKKNKWGLQLMRYILRIPRTPRKRYF